MRVFVVIIAAFLVFGLILIPYLLPLLGIFILWCLVTNGGATL